ncbi:amidohydrolase family protein [Streptomyces sp. NPDC001980]|uniref:amidohydrolase family protein n=1 Tax=Streptomyces sp. NPDC001980 TaxID=3157126 RepID=UPI003320F121
MPKLRLPPGSCDAHCHVFGPADVFPYAPGRTFTPLDAPKEQLHALHAHLGLTRAVVVQSSCHGPDHRVLVDALAAGAGRIRGVALIGTATSRADAEELHRAGVRAFRLNFLPHLRSRPTSAEIEAVLERVDGLGWAAQLHVRGEDLPGLTDLVRALPGRVVIDHMGRVELGAGRDGPAVRCLRALLDTGEVWVKVSGVDRVSAQGPPYADAVELAASLVAYAPERVVWGTDYPHVNIVGPAPDDGLLVDLLERIASNPAHLQRLLVDNPAELFDFEPIARPKGRWGYPRPKAGGGTARPAPTTPHSNDDPMRPPQQSA